MNTNLYRDVALALTKMEIRRWKYEGFCKLTLQPRVMQCKYCDLSDLTADACLSLVRLKKGLR